MSAIITKFTRPVARTLFDDIQKALDVVSKVHGVTLSVSGGTYTEAECTVKVKGVITTPEKGVVVQAVKAYNINRRLHSLPRLGTVFTAQNKLFKIKGWNTRARKYKVQTTCVATGDTYVFSPRRVAILCGS